MKITGTAAISFFNSTICTIRLLVVVGTSATSDCFVEVYTNSDGEFVAAATVVVVGAIVVVGAETTGLLWKKDVKLSKASKKMFPEVVVSGALVVVVVSGALVVAVVSEALVVVVVSGALVVVVVDTDSVDTDSLETFVGNAVVMVDVTDVVETIPAADDDTLVVDGIADVVDTDCSIDLIEIGAFVTESEETFSGNTIVIVGVAAEEEDTVSNDDAECVVDVMDTDSVGLEAVMVGVAKEVDTVSNDDAECVVVVMDADSVGLEVVMVVDAEIVDTVSWLSLFSKT